MQKQLTCIQCPNGCRLTAIQLPDGSVKVTGNLCRKGEEFGTAELTDPRRSVTTTVRTLFADLPFLPVRTDAEVRKADIPRVLAAARQTTVTQRLHVGDAAVENADGSGIKLIATMDM